LFEVFSISLSLLPSPSTCNNSHSTLYTLTSPPLSLQLLDHLSLAFIRLLLDPPATFNIFHSSKLALPRILIEPTPRAPVRREEGIGESGRRSVEVKRDFERVFAGIEEEKRFHLGEECWKSCRAVYRAG